ncbi:tetratricopeptide repeat protein [Methylocapsa sp. D3K7]|uniref:alpha/beta fold hydrolase n=1 Tax=Methylocapsa sp. D3K7 TaxID=3041435 RepID=UPI00244EC941|nr:alpha/beta fold hydrolase [Methylocapsa sp. D3K7]WGJ13471.1 tetratricopeptide repeat protein [Methylocapsa sp. D3K7]
MAELFQIAEARGSKSDNVIFFHGLGGDAHATWQADKDDKATFWLPWLAQDIEGLSVYSVGYEAPVSNWHGSAMELADRAANVLKSLLVEANLEAGEIVLAGHSLGGLVIKQLLRKAADAATDSAEAFSFMDRVRKVAFLATPHVGADLAGWGDRLRLLVRPSSATRSLIRNDQHLRDLNLWYRRWARTRKIDHLILTETKTTPIFGMVVKPDSSDPGLATDPVPVETDHIAIAKPANRDSNIYKFVRDFILRHDERPVSHEEKKIDNVKDDTQAIRENVERLPASIAEQVVALMDKREIAKAAEAGLERSTILELARPLRPGEVIDLDQAVVELRSAVGIALDVIAKGERGTNEGAFVEDVLKRLAETTKRGDFDSGAKAVDDALAELDRREEEQRAASRRSREILLEAGVEQDLLRRDPAGVARRIEAIAAMDTTDGHPAWSPKYRERWDAFFVEGQDKGVNLSLEVSIAMVRRMLDSARESDQRGTALNLLGVALSSLGEREGGTKTLNKAVDAYREALKEYTRERVPLDWAMIQNNLGNALTRLGERESGTETLNKAVDAYREALKEYTRERVPLDWAMIQNNLGNALSRLGERESGTETLNKAVEAYREALKEWTRERVPLDWATTQNNLGTALFTLGERESGTETLNKAVEAYREALKERTRERVPLDWATTQNNLGNALWRLGERESGTETLTKAVEACREALKERTRERVPLDWAMTQNNLGNALSRLGERESGTETLTKAVDAYREALTVFDQERSPYYWQRSQNNLNRALALIAERQVQAGTTSGG